ncbi:MAG TPA: hypothetical protein VFY14_09290 [Streptomyces sp.]|nr:hypothetical protein [Streptomyces sp.]
MASNTAPAAVPGPNQNSTTPTSPPAPAPGGLTGMLTPVEPARPATFNLNPDTPAQDADGTTTAEGASSAAYHDPGQPENTKNGTQNTSRQERSVVRAWLLAGAERWKKGADARNKRLELKKAKAQSRQVKETVTVNRSGGTLGNSTTRSNGTSGGRKGSTGKSLNSKTNGGGSPKTPKNPTPGPSRNNSGTGPAGNSGRGGNGGTSGSGGGAGRGPAATNGSSGPRGGGADKPRPKKDGGSTPKQTHGVRHGGDLPPRPKNTDRAGKDNGPKNSSGGTKSSPTSGGSGKAGRDGKAGAQGPAGGTGKTIPTQTSGKTTSGKGGSTQQPGKPVDLKKTNRPDKPGKDKPSTAKAGDQAQPTKPRKKLSLTKGGKTEKNPGPVSKQPNTPTEAPSTPAGKRLNVQPSREAGYRDGTRAATLAAHVGAWRDGTRDGWHDTQQAAAREKTRLDKAHTERKNARTNPKDKPVTQPASSADYHPTIPPRPDHAPGPQPVQVAGIDATRIQLGTGAARPDISRGEVRRLRDFQQRLHAKTDTMTRVGEATRVLEQHAQEQARQVTQLLEQARGVKGGDKLVAALTKLQEAATTQTGKAAEIRTRAARATEACKALTANTDTRYGGIYQAVVDSPETSPAEMRYYRQMETASV